MPNRFHTECSAFVTLLENLGIPFTWYVKDLKNQYLSKLRESWWNIDDLNLVLMSVEVGGTLIVFERECGRFVLVDSLRGKATLEGSFTDIIHQADATVQLRNGEKLDRVGAELWPATDYDVNPLVTPHEVRFLATVTDRIENWICLNARDIIIAQHGKEQEPDDDLASVGEIGDITVFSNSDERPEDEVYFRYTHGDGTLLEVTFPARYLWSKDWQEQLQKDTQEARKARRASELANRRRHVEAKRAELKRLEDKLAQLEGEGLK